METSKTDVQYSHRQFEIDTMVRTPSSPKTVQTLQLQTSLEDDDHNVSNPSSPYSVKVTVTDLQLSIIMMTAHTLKHNNCHPAMSIPRWYLLPIKRAGSGSKTFPKPSETSRSLIQSVGSGSTTFTNPPNKSRRHPHPPRPNPQPTFPKISELVLAE
ncbi:hypothetical protein CHS0354_032152 [Potamilus streckersoni]|uniref:Uncharacterized protein n=1 Tax=Potamilus streckersoni TaxID=2493646 RepID=A0AAE0WCW9_9BIVA|nr:hypothetical protein CHS0354_032152 [Potamilus streckersoni]